MQADGKMSGLPVWGPSPGKDPIFRETAKDMEIEDIHECIDYFAKSAAHAADGGFDGIELQLGHSSLIRQFLSPATNLRDDDYGGSYRQPAAIRPGGRSRRCAGRSAKTSPSGSGSTPTRCTPRAA